VGLEWGPLSLVSTTEELLARESSEPGVENREYSRRESSRWPRGTLYPQKLAPTSTASGGRSVCIVRSLTHATEFSFFDNFIFITSEYEESLGFWTLSIVQNSKYKETERFGNWICFRPQMRGGGDIYSVGSRRKSSSIQQSEHEVQ
jgi:hypothetical protein